MQVQHVGRAVVRQSQFDAVSITRKEIVVVFYGDVIEFVTLVKEFNMGNNIMFNTSAFGAFRGHHRDWSLKEQLEAFDPKLFQRLRDEMQPLGAPLEHSLAAFLMGVSPFCGCGELKQLSGYKLRPYCRACSIVAKYEKGRITAKAKAERFLENLPKKLPLSKDHLQFLIRYSKYIGGWEAAIDRVRPQFKKKFLSYYRGSAPKMNGAFRNFLLKGEPNFCSACGVALMGTRDSHCPSCRMKTTEMRTKVRNSTIANNGGVGFGSKKIQKKAVSTMMKRYGVHCGVAGHLHAKAREAMVAKHGTTNVMAIGDNLEKHKARYLDKKWVAGVVSKVQATKEKTMGADWRAIESERLNDARYKRYYVKCGKRLLKMQGYEPYVVQELISRGCHPGKIEIYQERFSYIKSSTKRKSVYVPDIVVPTSTGRMILEVKSTYTAGLGNQNRHYWEQLREKSRAVADAGEVLTLVVVNPTRGIFRLESPHLYTRTEALRLVKYEPFSYSDEVRRNVRITID